MGFLFEFNARKRNREQLPTNIHIKRINQSHIRFDKVKTRGVDCLRTVFESAVSNLLSRLA